jgi:hypothetical protein
MDTAYNMFSKNLFKASMLTYVYIFNVADLDVEVDFLLGHEDKAQWNVRIVKTDMSDYFWPFFSGCRDRSYICGISANDVTKHVYVPGN